MVFSYSDLANSRGAVNRSEIVDQPWAPSETSTLYPPSSHVKSTSQRIAATLNAHPALMLTAACLLGVLLGAVVGAVSRGSIQTRGE